MMAVQIQSFRRVVPMIYAYNTPGIPYHDGWTKVGYTERQSVVLPRANRRSLRNAATIRCAPSRRRRYG